MRQSGLADLVPSLRRESVYVGVSAGSMVVTADYGENLAGNKPPVPAYLIDDQTAIQVVDGTVDVVSEGHWKLVTHE
jgi:dipeptidase E